MRQHKRRDLEDAHCPHCGRFYFLPDEELLGMRHIHLKQAQHGAVDRKAIHHNHTEEVR